MQICKICTYAEPNNLPNKTYQPEPSKMQLGKYANMQNMQICKYAEYANMQNM